MKDILVEFTDYGAIIHKDPLVIASKRDLPYCFFNPDLSKVSGVSPSYWIYKDEIIPASPEERKRRDEYHKGKPSENTVSLKQTMDLMREEIINDIQVDINEIEKTLEYLKSYDQQTVNTFNYKTVDLSNSIDFIVKSFRDTKELTNSKIEQLEKEIKYLKIGLIVSVLLSIALKLI